MAGRVMTLGLLACAVACALLVWPGFLRGGAPYVIVSGNSMEPTLHSGDLVFTVRRGTYEVGDVVAYRIPAGTPGAGVLVIHRIVGGSASSGYVMQGDNRAGRDAWRPRPGDIVGAQALTVPRVGIGLAWARTPLGLATLAAIATALIVFGSGNEGQSEGRRRAASQSRRRRGAYGPAGSLLAIKLVSLDALAPVRIAARLRSSLAAWLLRARRIGTGSSAHTATNGVVSLTDRQRHGNAFPIALSQSWGEASWTARDLWKRSPRPQPARRSERRSTSTPRVGAAH